MTLMVPYLFLSLYPLFIYELSHYSTLILTELAMRKLLSDLSRGIPPIRTGDFAALRILKIRVPSHDPGCITAISNSNKAIPQHSS
jgi:hypothetical protein